MDDHLAALLREAGEPGDPHADLYARRLAGPPTLDEPEDPGPPAHLRREFTDRVPAPPNGFAG